MTSLWHPGLTHALSTQAHWQTSVVNHILFRRRWQHLLAGRTVSRTFIAMVCAVLSHSLLLAPGYNPASRLPIQPQHVSFCLLAHQLVLRPDATIFDTTESGIDELIVQCLIVTYMSFSGWPEPAWTATGQAIRACKAVRLYDEDKWAMRELSDWDIEIRRRVAWDLCACDRWLSLHFLRIADLPGDIRASRPTYYNDECYDPDTGRLNTKTPTQRSDSSFEEAKYQLSRGAVKVSSFLNRFHTLAPEERYQEARQIEDFFVALENGGFPSNLRFELACDVNNLKTPDGSRRACHSLIAYSSAWRLRCTVMRQFLLDLDAPIDLRTASLEHARKIIEATPILVTLSSSPWVSFSSSWCSGHLFCAASTFAIVYLGETEQDLQDLNWFASKIFEVIEALAFLGVKDRVAKRCEELLTALCTSKDWLRDRFLASRSGKAHLQRRNLPQPSPTDHPHMAILPGVQSLLPESSTSIYSLFGKSTPYSTKGLETTGVASDKAPSGSRAKATAGVEQTTPPQSSESLGKGTPDSTDAWPNWPLLDDKQWAALLNTL